MRSGVNSGNFWKNSETFSNNLEARLWLVDQWPMALILNMLGAQPKKINPLGECGVLKRHGIFGGPFLSVFPDELIKFLLFWKIRTFFYIMVALKLNKRKKNFFKNQKEKVRFAKNRLTHALFPSERERMGRARCASLSFGLTLLIIYRYLGLMNRDKVYIFRQPKRFSKYQSF